MTTPTQTKPWPKWAKIILAIVGALIVLVFLAIIFSEPATDDTAVEESTSEAEPTDRDAALLERTQEMHRLIDLGIEGCQWDIPDEWTNAVISGCEENGLFTVVSGVESVTMNVMEAMADANPWPAYYAIEDGAGVLAFDAGDRNLAQDMLGGGALTSGSFDS